MESIQTFGYAVRRGPCSGGANGITDFTARTVVVRDDVSDAQAAKTLAHELGHIRADHETRFLAEYGSSLGCRAQAEVEAESIAFLVTHAAGLTSEAYSVPYLAGWSGGDSSMLRDAATRAIGTARGIVTDLRLDCPAADLEPLLPEYDRAPRAPQPHAAERDGPSPC
ncbi:ImmA/IrrE family metallo-endopeptidase [Sporichthya sp.]|uniref:ImmA/IrrE family metallo-endopeptidase n=1 Tax=Sporichthya sp. TaxID=65475 RepID=UPI0025CD9D56|nr:ImmA/IrrE family metallo-endopeptidase [Sporichthya sp.]